MKLALAYNAVAGFALLGVWCCAHGELRPGAATILLAIANLLLLT